MDGAGDSVASEGVDTGPPRTQAQQRQHLFSEMLACPPATVVALSRHAFGNYVVQKFLECGSPEQAAAVASSLRGHIVSLSEHPFACRVVQTVRRATSCP